MTAAEAARFLGVSVSTVYRRIRKGSLKAYKDGRRWVIPLSRNIPKIEEKAMTYPGKCPADRYPVSVATVEWALNGVHVLGSQPDAPDEASFWTVQEHEAEVEIEAGGKTAALQKGDGPANGVWFVDDAPGETRSGEPFRARARMRWVIQDTDPEDRGHLLGDGIPYPGAWSAWTDWQTLTSEYTPEPLAAKTVDMAGHTLGSYVQARREQLGFTQNAVGQAIGKDAGYVERIETGALQGLSESRARTLAGVLQVDAQAFRTLNEGG